MKPHVLVVDDDPALAESLADGLADAGFDAVAVASSTAAAERLAAGGIDALVTDLRMPEIDGLGLLAISRRDAPERPVVVMTAFSAIESAIASVRQGAYHYLTKPFKVDELALFLDRALAEVRLRREARALKDELAGTYRFANVLAASPSMRAVCELLARVADATAPVLLLGETGTGKSLLARALHAQGRRAAQRFVTINCAAVPEALLESELFGHLKGAFSGATADRPGLFVEASGGTLLLDEVAEMSLGTQAKLLDVVERGVVRPVGGDRERPVDVRLVTATHRDLRTEVRVGRFREDLLYRLNVVAAEVPALRDRRADIPLLAEHFLARARAQHPHSKAQRLSASATRKLVAAAWPGNVRELQHAIERAVLLANAEEIGEADFSPDTLAAPETPIETGFGSDVVPMKAMQRRYARWTLARVEGRKMIACEKLDIDPKTLNRLLDDEND